MAIIDRPLRLLHEILPQLTAASAGKTVAVVEGTAHSYRELGEQSSHLAQALLQRGLVRGDRVAIYMDNTWACIVAIFATLRAGGVFMVINPQTKPDKLQFLLNDSGAAVMFTDSHLEPWFVDGVKGVAVLRQIICSGKAITPAVGDVRFERLDDVIARSEPLVRPVQLVAGDLCSLIYTSGSTGNPKGVMHTHASMVFVLHSLIEYLRIDSDDVILNVLPMAFDYGLYQLFMAVRIGATLVLERSFTYPAQVLARIEEFNVTVFPGVPTIFAMLIASHKRSPLALRTIRRVTNTAAALSSEWIPTLKEIFPNALIYKMYGLTECKRTCYLEPELIDSHGTSVGKAIPGTEVFLLSADGDPVAPGGEGILHVRGPHVMLGYWNQPELSAHMLKPWKLPYERVLCTHDWFRMDKEGFLYFIGRQDDIIKSRGEKVSPLEVENILLALDGVHEVAVIGVDDDVLGQAIRAFVALREGSALDVKLIRRHCSTHLENFMVPRDIVILPVLPKSPNGKIDKKQLKAST